MALSITLIGHGRVAKHVMSHAISSFHHIISTSYQSTAPSYSHQHTHIDIYSPQKIHLPPTTHCLITIPFSRSLTNPNDYTNRLSSVFNQLPLNQYKTVIFTSSTSIYKANNATVDEMSPVDITERAQALNRLETILLSQCNTAYILRLSGICGLSTRTNKSHVVNGHHPINVIHADDIAGIIHQLCHHNGHSDIINVTATSHPTKTDFYSHMGYNITSSSTHQMAYKRVSNHKLCHHYGYTLTYPNPLKFPI